MLYAPPQLQKHAAAIARLARADRSPAPVSRAIRLAEAAGSNLGRVCKSFNLKDAPVAQLDRASASGADRILAKNP